MTAISVRSSANKLHLPPKKACHTHSPAKLPPKKPIVRFLHNPSQSSNNNEKRRFMRRGLKCPSMLSPSLTESPRQETRRIVQDSLQSNKKRRYMRRGSKCASMFMLSSMANLEDDEDSTNAKEKHFTLSFLTEALHLSSSSLKVLAE